MDYDVFIFPKAYYHVKITQVNCQHNCNLNTIHHHIAKQNSRRFEINLDKMTSILQQLYHNPNMSPMMLEQKLKLFLPSYIVHSNCFSDRFKSRALNYISHQNNFDEFDAISHNDFMKLVNDNKNTADKTLCSEPPIQRQNLKKF